jgi:hypothetical protein
VLVEEILQRQRPRTLARIGRVERRVGMAALELGDDPRRIADRFAVELEQRERPAAAEPPRPQRVQPGRRRAKAVSDALEVERPAGLLVVVREGDVPEHRRGHRASDRIAAARAAPARR